MDKQRDKRFERDLLPDRTLESDGEYFAAPFLPEVARGWGFARRWAANTSGRRARHAVTPAVRALKRRFRYPCRVVRHHGVAVGERSAPRTAPGQAG